MGKKGKDKKKGKGAEKTATKTEKKGILKQKKLLAKIGEADIEQLITKCEEEQKRQLETIEQIVPPPSSRVNFSMCSHPEKEEIIIFGGELFDGKQTTIYNDLYFYNIPKNEWKLLKSPAGPTPRSSHQMVSVASAGGQLWLYGGEYASPSQLQFYHFKDLWVFHLNSKKWEKVNAKGVGPSARSGHRMVAAKKQLIIFGGFHDNNQAYRYFNDVHIFSMENYTWTKIEPMGPMQPLPRSGCCMVVNQEGKILIWGGYSRSEIKKKIDRGVTHADMYSLIQDKGDATGLKWKWSVVKAGGMRPPPRSGMTVAVAPNGKAYAFGGVLDTEEDEENLLGQLSNDLHMLDLSNPVWRLIELVGKKDKSKKKDKVQDVEMEEKAKDEDQKTVTSDGVFTMVVGPSKSSGESSKSDKSAINVPSPRMNSGVIICKGNLYLFGGILEDGDKQLTLCDFYSLDLHKLDSWKTLIQNTVTSKDWLESDSDDDSDKSGDDDDDDETEDDDDSEDDDSSEMDTD